MSATYYTCTNRITITSFNELISNRIEEFIYTSWCSSYPCLNESSGFKCTKGFASSNLIRFDGGLGFASWTTLLTGSMDPPSGPKVPLTECIRVVDLFHIKVDGRVVRLREIHRIERENTSKNGYLPIFGMLNLIQNNLLSHFDESWDKRKKQRTCKKDRNINNFFLSYVFLNVTWDILSLNEARPLISVLGLSHEANSIPS